jgi:hypothetical protein
MCSIIIHYSSNCDISRSYLESARYFWEVFAARRLVSHCDSSSRTFSEVFADCHSVHHCDLSSRTIWEVFAACRLVALETWAIQKFCELTMWWRLLYKEFAIVVWSFQLVCEKLIVIYIYLPKSKTSKKNFIKRSIKKCSAKGALR